MFSGTLLLLLLTLYSSPLTGVSVAEGPETVITSEGLEYDAAGRKYHMTGSVTATRQDAVITADEMTYSEETSEVTASGNVRYDDRETSIKAGKAVLNLEAKTGKLYDAEFLYKKNNYRLTGSSIEKKGEDHYYSPEATFTTCDTPVPDWCFRGKEVTAVMGDTLKAKDTSMRIRGLPVLYSPYVMASLNTSRQTGFLMPTPGYSDSRGASIRIPFFWAIAEDRDATVVIDYFSKRGTGEGLEYRFVRPGGVKSDWWAYHIRDTLLKKDFFEVRALHEDRDRGRVKGFLNLNYVNEKDYYREFESYREVRLQRYLESTAEASLPAGNSRLYLLSRYWVDLEHETGLAPQKLPEAGYVINYTRQKSLPGDVMAAAEVSATNLYRGDGDSAGRLDIYPRLFHRFGKDISVIQTAAVRETAYAFYNRTDQEAEQSVLRSSFEYDMSVNARLFRNFGSFSHIVEPSVRYHFVYSPKSYAPAPVYDETELFGKTSNIEFSILNRGIVKGRDNLSLRVSQALDTYNSDRPFLPFRLEAGVRAPVALLLDTTYDYYSGRVETVRSDFGLQVLGADFSFGQRFNRKEDINVFTVGAAFSPSKELHVAGSIWYDATGAGLRDVAVTLKYSGQCWGVRLETTRRPDDFSVRFMLELTGVSTGTALR